MIVSLNKVESAVLKAARGAGLSWGIAEEVAAAARWLAARGFACLPTVLGTLECEQATSPLPLGIRFADLAGTEDVTAASVDHALLLVAFAASASARSNKVITIDAGEAGDFEVDAAGVRNGRVADLTTPPRRLSVRLRTTNITGRPATAPITTEVTVSAEEWQRLEALGARTYVPASTRSRLSGACAGLEDND